LRRTILFHIDSDRGVAHPTGDVAYQRKVVVRSLIATEETRFSTEPGTKT